MPGKKRHPEGADHSQLDLWSAIQDFNWEDFKVAREYIRSIGLHDYAGWEKFVRDGNHKDNKIPPDPDQVYQHLGWNGWHDWLGIEEPAQKEEKMLKELFERNSENGLWSNSGPSKWMNFHEARQMVRELGFEYEEEWRLFTDGKFPDRVSLPDNIPKNPDQVYRHVGWMDWKDWLIRPERQVEYSRFRKAREFVRSCRIPDKGSWRDFFRDMAGRIEEYQMVLPVRPHLEYKESGWISWEDWLGSDINYHDFKSTRKSVHSLKLRTQKDWVDYCQGRFTHKPRKADSIFTYPEIAFSDEGWTGWEDWLGTWKEKDPEPSPAAEKEIMIDCKCKGKIENCPDCDGKGYYYVHLR
jgi:hypothetical protein